MEIYDFKLGLYNCSFGVIPDGMVSNAYMIDPNRFVCGLKVVTYNVSEALRQADAYAIYVEHGVNVSGH